MSYSSSSPVYADLQDDVDQAATIIERFQAVPEKAIPQAVLKDARGLAIMTVIKAGFGFSGRGGKGVVVAAPGMDGVGRQPLALVEQASASRLVLR